MNFPYISYHFNLNHLNQRYKICFEFQYIYISYEQLLQEFYNFHATCNEASELMLQIWPDSTPCIYTRTVKRTRMFWRDPKNLTNKQTYKRTNERTIVYKLNNEQSDLNQNTVVNQVLKVWVSINVFHAYAVKYISLLLLGLYDFFCFVSRSLLFQNSVHIKLICKLMLIVREK